MGRVRAGILMPCKGRLDHVRQAVDSLRAQTLRDFVAVIVDDGSDAETSEYLGNLSDRRFTLLRNETSVGVAASLNRGLKELERLDAGMVFRMDADDWAEPSRIAVQLEALETKMAGVIGTHVTPFTEKGPRNDDERLPLTHEEIAYRLCWSNALKHPTVAFLRTIVSDAGGYDESLPVGQDYDLWTRLIFRQRFANLEGKLLKYRLHADQATKQKSAILETVRTGIRRSYREKLVGFAPAAIFDKPEEWSADHVPTHAQWEQWLDWVELLQEKFQRGEWTFASVRPLDVRRDLARRIARTMTAGKNFGAEAPHRAVKIVRVLAPVYATLKGIW